MNNTTLILILILALIYIDQFITNNKQSINTFENLEFADSLIIIVTDNEFYYLNIKPLGETMYQVFRITLYLVQNFF